MDGADRAEPPPDDQSKRQRRLNDLDLEIPDDNAIDLVAHRLPDQAIFGGNFCTCHVIATHRSCTINASLQIVNHNLKPWRALCAVGIDPKKEKNRAVAICRRTQRYRIRALEESCEEALLKLSSTLPLRVRGVHRVVADPAGGRK